MTKKEQLKFAFEEIMRAFEKGEPDIALIKVDKVSKILLAELKKLNK